MKVYRHHGLTVQYREGEQPADAVLVETKQAPAAANKQRATKVKEAPSDPKGERGPARSQVGAADSGS
nr:MAG TPA: hypothetical protein [Caudoviricetes sp.]